MRLSLRRFSRVWGYCAARPSALRGLVLILCFRVCGLGFKVFWPSTASYLACLWSLSCISRSIKKSPKASPNDEDDKPTKLPTLGNSKVAFAAAAHNESDMYLVLLLAKQLEKIFVIVIAVPQIPSDVINADAEVPGWSHCAKEVMRELLGVPFQGKTVLLKMVRKKDKVAKLQMVEVKALLRVATSCHGKVEKWAASDAAESEHSVSERTCELLA